jgi:ribonuclease R/exosome complex exonuclease DIS3/RRP44
MVGKKSDVIYQLGDEVIVKVKNADLLKKHLDFYMVGKPEGVKE